MALSVKIVNDGKPSWIERRIDGIKTGARKARVGLAKCILPKGCQVIPGSLSDSMAGNSVVQGSVSLRDLTDIVVQDQDKSSHGGASNLKTSQGREANLTYIGQMMMTYSALRNLKTAIGDAYCPKVFSGLKVVTNPFLGVDENENDIIVRAPEINRSPLDRILNGSYSPEVQEIVKKAVETREITHEGQLIAMPYMIDNRLIGLTVLSGQVTEEDIVLAMNFKGMVETAIPHVMKSQEDNKKFDYDALTEIPNENLFRTELFRDFCQVGRGRVSNYSLIYIDIDHFKRINDKFTHDAGDDILKMLAAQLVSSVRGGDIVARLHGEEFVIGLPNTALIDALRIADSIRQSVSEHNFTVGNRKIPITISMGVANLPIHLKQVVQGEEDDAAAIFIHMADAALYAAKGEIENAYLVGKKIPSGDRNRVAVLMNGEYMLAPQAIEALCKQAANDAIAEKAENKGGVGVNPVEDSAGANAGSNGGGRQG